MEYLRKVVRTNKEPDEKEVLWVDTAHPDYPVMKYYENGNWKLIRQREDGVAYIMPYGGIPYSDLSQEVKMAIASGGAQANWNQTNSASPDFIWNKPYIPTALADLTEDSNHKFVSAAEKTSWSNKAEVSDIPDVSNFITASVDNLVNYYLKSETYTKAEVQALIGAIQQFHYEIYASTAAVTNPQGNVLYLIGPTGTGEDKYEEYVYDVTKQNPWVKIGDTSIDLSGFVTTSDLDTALSAYTTSADLSDLLDAKQDVINDLDDIRDGAAAGATAYQKPNTGIPASDLAAGVIPTVPTDVVKYSSQSLTDAQKTQARNNIGASKPELLVAEYNVTPFATVITACLAGKNVIVKKNENYKYVVYSLTMWDGDAQIGGTVKFSRINYSSTTSGTIDTISVDNVDGWKILESIPYQESFFIAQYGVTHWSEVLAAYKDGKVLLCRLTTLAQLMVFDPGFEGDDESEPYEGSAAFIYYDPIEKKLIQLVIDGSTDEWQMNRLRYVSDFDGRYASLSGKPTIPDVTGKADKVSNATNGHLAALDGNGNLTDSGKSASDFATAAQGAKADTALQSFTETDPTVPSWAKASSKPSYDYSEISNTPTIPDAVEANPTVPSGTTPGTMETIKIGSQYYELGGGTIDAEDYSGVAPVIVNPSNYYTKTETEALVETPVASTQPSGGFLPNVIYDLGEITGSVTFALATPTDNTIANTYVWTFETGSTAPTIVWPSNLTWLGGSAPTINTGKHYEITVRKGYANGLEF